MRHTTISSRGSHVEANGDYASCFAVGHCGVRHIEAAGFYCGDGAMTSQASVLSARNAFEIFRQSLLESWATSVNATSSDRVRSALHYAVIRTNRLIFEQALTAEAGSRELHVSAITGLVTRSILMFNTMGNVVLLLLRDGRFHLLSEDQSFAGALQRKGLLRPSAALRHPFARLSSRRLGSFPDVHPSFRSLALQPGDILLTMTDGMGELRVPGALNRRLAHVLSAFPPGQSRGDTMVGALQQAFQHQLKNTSTGTDDDATVLLMSYDADDHEHLHLEAPQEDQVATLADMLNTPQPPTRPMPESRPMSRDRLEIKTREDLRREISRF
jgi:serine/threonine protein phosphatase PrpC